MGPEDKITSGEGMECGKVFPSFTSRLIKNGFSVGLLDHSNNKSFGVREDFHTYKRRKRSSSTHGNIEQSDGRLFAEAPIQSAREELVNDVDNNSHEKGSLPIVNSLGNLNDSQTASLEHWRNVFLKHMCQSLSVDGGLQECIRYALLLSDTKTSCEARAKECTATDQSINGRPSSSIPDGAHNASNTSALSNGSIDKSNCQTVTDRCQQTFYNMIMSEKFALLSKLLCETFQGTNVNKLFHLNLVNKKMKEGTYESSPLLFLFDIEEVWTKLQGIGTEMACLAKSLLDMSRTNYDDLVGCTVKGTFEVGNHKESDNHTKPEQQNALKDCKTCGKKTNEGNFLACNSCEDMYHFSCIGPSSKYVPSKSWSCPICTAKETKSLHQNCVVCERMEALRMQMRADEIGDESIRAIEEINKEMEDSSESSMGKISRICKVCRSEVREDEEDWVCGHPYCLNKFYHSRCLTSKESKLYGPRWYCPSCLCRTCLTDRDDDKIVLCDGCDHAYHLYCMNPPRSTIPKGKWFCIKCDAGIQEIRRVKKAYEKLNSMHGEGHSHRQTGKEQNWKVDRDSDKGRGMDMLLSAAKTLNYVDKLAITQQENYRNDSCL